MARERDLFLLAAVLGAVHGGFSLYWGGGGDGLAWSLGSDQVAALAGRQWLLLPVGLGKLVGAVAPLVLARWGWPLRRLSRAGCWLGAVLLVVWGGINSALGNAVLAGLIRPAAGFDRPGMIGHAYLWDPLFLAWGVAVMVGLLLSRASAESCRCR